MLCFRPGSLPTHPGPLGRLNAGAHVSVWEHSAFTIWNANKRAEWAAASSADHQPKLLQLLRKLLAISSQFAAAMFEPKPEPSDGQAVS